MEEAWRRNPGQLMVGFNRRWSDSVRRVREHFGDSGGPLVLTYRVNAGPVLPGHWYNDRRQGGRLLGEVCHFIDTCNAIVGAAPVDVHAIGAGRGEALLAEDLAVTLGYRDGSVAAITYATGGQPAAPKERLEILGRDRSALIDDFRALELDGRHMRNVRPGKGHADLLNALRRVITSAHSGSSVADAALASTRAVLHAVSAYTETLGISAAPSRD